MKLLIVDHDSAFRFLTRSHLDAFEGPVEVFEAEDLGQALTQVQRDVMDVILLDPGLPDSSGAGTLQAMVLAAPTSAIIVLSGQPYDGRAIRQGAVEWLPKGELTASSLHRNIRHAMYRQAQHAQRAELEAQVRRADQLASVGVLAAGVAHEVNNPALVLAMNLEYIREQLEEALPSGQRDQVMTALGECQVAVGVIGAVARRLTDYARREAPVVGPFDIAETMDDAIGLVKNRIRHQARLVVSRPLGVQVVGDRTGVLQLLVNLLMNGGDAIEAKGEGLGALHLSAALVGSCVEISIRDDGVGMSPELKSRAFETFFTTKSAGHGTGLGLALVDDIVAFHKGHIEVDSSPGQGTTVRVSLPAVPSTSPAPTPDPAQSQVGANRILLIDDDPLVCRTLVRLLGRHLDVSVENSGQAAITRLSEEAFDAVLCDVSMPGMSGPEILRQVAPRLRSRFVFLTGGAITGQDRAFIESCERPVLMKPIAPADLLAAIARVASLHA